jgi:hypothetical protein
MGTLYGSDCNLARVRRVRFLIANIQAVCVLVTSVKLGRNLRRSGLWNISLLFDVVLQTAVTVRQTRDLTCRTTP